MPIELKLNSFKFTVESHTELVISEDQPDLVFRFNLHCRGESATANGTDSGEVKPQAFEVRIDRRHFRDKQQLKDWIAGTWGNAWQLLSGELLGVTVITYKIAMEKTANDLGIVAIDLKGLAQDATRMFERANKEILELRNAGRPPAWTKDKLKQATQKAVAKVYKKKYRPPKLSDVAEIFNKRYPNKGPFTANSVRQLFTRHGIDWKSLKTAQN